MIVLHAAPVRCGRLAGLSTSVPALVAAQNDLPGVEAALLQTVPGNPWPSCSFPAFACQAVCRRTGRLNLPAPFSHPDLVVFHSSYILLHARLARYLRRHAIPYLICPRGGMTRHAHLGKRWKKVAGNLLFFNRLVRGAKAIHFLTPGEAAASAAWRVPSFVVGNGVQLPPLGDAADARQKSGAGSVRQPAMPGRAESGFQRPVLPQTHPRRVVFMGRLHIDHKGLDMLVDACARISTDLVEAGIVVEIYGPDCDGSAAQLDRQIAQAHAHRVVALRGPVDGRAKAELLDATDIFVHPSRTEGHPLAVLEALAHGAPCLLTPNTNMAEAVVNAAAGWGMDASVEGIVRGLRSVLRLPHIDLLRASRNARILAETSFSWPEVAQRSVAEYQRFAA